MVNTISGEVDYRKLGFTLIHEHVIVNPNTPNPDYDDFRLVDHEKAVLELNRLKELGCETVADLTPINYGRNIEALSQIANESGMIILATTGFHKEEFLPDYVETATINDLVEVIVSEVENGIDGSNIKPALIKCSSSYQMITENELKCFRAACRSHLITGIPISTHSDKGTMLLEQLRIFQDEGINLSKVILGHVDLSLDKSLVETLLKSGVNVQFDHIGRSDEVDNFVLEMVEMSLNLNAQSQIFISQDMGRKKYLASYGGTPGLTYAFKEFKEKFISRFNYELFEQIFKKNVRKYFK